MKQRIVLTNHFHNTTAVVLSQDNRLNGGQARRAWKQLCGIKGCTCGDAFGARGPQFADGVRIAIIPISSDSYAVECA